ncbi:hypothetical protein SCHPADRAFT_794213, partial [Schizopora paradoxa]
AASSSSASKVRCFQCLAEVELRRIRQHVGDHILKWLRDVHENLKGDAIVKMPCGFCGRSGVAACNEVFLTKGRSPQAKSGCQYAYQFKYQPSLKPSKTSPCTNVPILCRIPGCTGTVGEKLTAVWKYNMAEHIRLFHPGYTSSYNDIGMAPLPPGMMEEMYVSVEEEIFMKIPNEKIP